MMQEIGSEFWNVPVVQESNSVLPDKTHWFLSGRHALKTILQDAQSTHSLRWAALPSWCCESIIKPFIEAGIKVYFYPVIFKQGSLLVDYSQVADCDVILIMDYFGYNVTALTQNISTPIIIRDITHSIFSCKYNDAHYYFGSLRKWAGFISGGFAWKNTVWDKFSVLPADKNYVSLRIQAMQSKKEFIEQQQNDKKFLSLFQQAGKALEQLNGIYQGLEEDRQKALKLDINLIKSKRRQNANYLLKQLAPYALFKELKSNDCPLFLPILLKNRDKVRDFLISKNIYCPIHWPITSLHNLTEEEKYIYMCEISIVCDQRYSVEDMQYIISCLQECNLQRA